MIYQYFLDLNSFSLGHTLTDCKKFFIHLFFHFTCKLFLFNFANYLSFRRFSSASSSRRFIIRADFRAGENPQNPAIDCIELFVCVSSYLSQWEVHIGRLLKLIWVFNEDFHIFMDLKSNTTINTDIITEIQLVANSHNNFFNKFKVSPILSASVLWWKFSAMKNAHSVDDDNCWGELSAPHKSCVEEAAELF